VVFGGKAIGAATRWAAAAAWAAAAMIAATAWRAAAMETAAAKARSAAAVKARAGMAVKPMRIISGMPTAAEIAIAIATIIAGADEYAAAIPAIIRVAVVIPIIASIAAIPIAVPVTGADITPGKRCGDEQTKRQAGRPRSFQERCDCHDAYRCKPNPRRHKLRDVTKCHINAARAGPSGLPM
jgi:hypothetical protein